MVLYYYFSLGRSSSPSRSGHRRTRSIAASAIANLRACNEEMRNTVKELRDDVDALKASLYKSKKAKVISDKLLEFNIILNSLKLSSEST